MADQPRRIARILLAGTAGVFVALVVVVLRPDGAPFERSQSIAASGAPADARTAAVDRASETPPPPSAVALESALVPAADVAQPPNLAGALSKGAATPAAPAASRRGSAERQEERAADAEEGLERPAQWCFLKTRADHDYRSDSSVVFNGSRSVFMGKENDVAAAGGYFSSDILWQGVDATAFRGLRIEVSTRVKGMGYFQFFVRTATAEDREIVLSDRQLPSVPMTNRYVRMFPPNGAEWVRLSIVADIPLAADVVYYGVALYNGRAIWIDDMRIARVDARTPLTAELSHGGHSFLPVNRGVALAAPSNLDFELATRGAPGC